jgi:hypothetical protein
LNQTSSKPRFTASAFVVLFAGFCRVLEAGEFMRVLSLSRVSKNMRCVFGLSGRRLSRSLLGGDTLVNRQSCGQTVQLRVAKRTRPHFVSRVTRLYEQGSIHEVIEGYVRRWRCWARSGLKQWATLLTLDDVVDDCLRIQRWLASPLRRCWVREHQRHPRTQDCLCN